MSWYVRTRREGPRRGWPKASGLVLVRSPLLTGHKWRELVSSGFLVCRCHDVFLWCYLRCVLLRFRLCAFVEAAALGSIVLRYAGATTATRVSFFFLFIWRCRFFRVFFVPFPLSLCMESTSYVLSFWMVLFYLVTTGWIFDISLYVRIQLINQIDHGESPLLKSTGIQIATKPMPGPTNREHQRRIGVKTMPLGTNYSLYCLGCCRYFRI